MPGKYDDLTSLSLRRGFLYPAAEIYGGLAGFYDYGHLGATLKRNWEDLWLETFLNLHENSHLLDTTNILPFRSLDASGHVDHFTDVMLTCRACGRGVMAEWLLEQAGIPGAGLAPDAVDGTVKEKGLACPDCGGAFGPAAAFNMMFPVAIGPGGKDEGFLRPETAQGAYLAFKREHESLRRVLPLGLAIIGRAFRNEISPRQGTYRMREFIQAELQIFFNPAKFDAQLPAAPAEVPAMQVATAAEARGGEAPSRDSKALEADLDLPPWFTRHMAVVWDFYVRQMGFPPERLRFRELGPEERAFYNRLHYDLEVEMESFGGYREVAGVHYRGDHDLSGHQVGSNKRMAVPDDGDRVVPHVLELSFGVDRTLWGLLDVHYDAAGDRIVLRLPPRLAPVQVGVFPHLRKDGLPEKARQVLEPLRGRFRTAYDASGSIGRRYARMDEIGTPYCVTVDHETLEGKGVTLRDRDSREQARVPEDDLPGALDALFGGRGLPRGLAFGPLD